MGGKMILTIVKKEIQQNLKSFKFMVITLLILVTVLSSLYIMYNDYLLRVENYEILRPTSKEPIAITPPTPLSIFVKGLDETIGRSYRIWFGGQIQVGSQQQSVNNLFRLFNNPDLLYIVKVIISLCAILFAFDMVSGEKESHTLSLSLSNGFRRTSLITGKWFGGFISFIVPFVIVVLLGTIFILFSPHVKLNHEQWAKLGLFILSSVIYLAFFFSLGLFISCITHSSASSLVFSLFLWALIVFVTPNLGNTLARQLVRIPSVQQLEMKREHIWIKEVFDFSQAMRQGDNSRSFDDALAAINSENDKLMADYRTRFNGLVYLSKNITRFSPSAAFTYLATDIVGTGIKEEYKMKEAVLNYKDMVWNKPTDSGGNILGDFPAFTFKRSTTKEVLAAGGLMNFTILVLFYLISFAAAYVAFIRYDVR